LAVFVLAALPLCLVAVFEIAKGWHLYHAIEYAWGEGRSGYLDRAGLLRASASAISPIVLGFVIMVALGCLIALQQNGLRQNMARIGFALLGAGLIASLSRGPWVGAASLVVIYLITGPNAVTKLAKLAALGGISTLLLLPTPIGAKLVDFLPFIGSIDAANVEYRQRLITNALTVVERHPWLGSVDYLSTPEMQEMIQGQGIIDVVNTYLGVVLEYGIVGLTLFVGFFASVLFALRRSLRATSVGNPELRTLLRVSIATLVAILVTIGTVSSVSYIPYVYWSFAGLCMAVVRIAYAQRAVEVYQASPKTVLG
jgi:O-antigen ligase